MQQWNGLAMALASCHHLKQLLDVALVSVASGRPGPNVSTWLNIAKGSGGRTAPAVCVVGNLVAPSITVMDVCAKGFASDAALPVWALKRRKTMRARIWQKKDLSTECKAVPLAQRHIIRLY